MHPAKTRRPRRLNLEYLENRLALTAYFVSTTGDDANAGSPTAPFRTLQHAADVVRAGDTVTVAPGEYTGFDLRRDGTSTSRITFTAQPGVTINQRNPVTPDGINLEGADFVTIEGFNVVGMPRTGIRSVLNQHVIIRNNVLDQNFRWGILTGFSDDVLIEGNTASRSEVEHGIYVSNSGDRPTIRNNTIFGNNANGIHMNGDKSLGGDGIITGALVEQNVIHDNGRGGGSGINGDGVQNSTIRNNLIYNSHASGISLYRIDGGGGSINNVVVNNTVLVASDGRWALNIQNGSTGNTIRNNILFTAHSFRGSIDISSDSLTGFTSDFNVVMNRFTTNGGNKIQTLAQWQASSNQDAHSLVATPEQLFVNPLSDFHLSDSSPAIDAGTINFAPSADLEGNLRPAGEDVDIGAYERGSTAPPNQVVSFDVQRGANQRSYVRFVDLIFENTNGLNELLNQGRMSLTKFDLSGTSGVNVKIANKASVADNRLTFDFGSAGIGGSRKTTAGDGYYQLSIDVDGDGVRETVRSFYRLLGDTNGDREVNAIDRSNVVANFGATGVNDADVNFSGLVDAADRRIVKNQLGRKIAANLSLDD